MSNDKRGFTLVELLVAMGIATIVFIGLAEGLVVSVDANLKTALSDEAAVVGENKINEIRSELFNNITTANFPPDNVVRSIRQTTATYNVTTTVTDLDVDLKQVDVRVAWSRRDYRLQQWNYTWDYSHSFSTIVRRTR